MLKLAVDEEEKRGNLVMAWWDGDGAAPVLARRRDALLMARGSATLASLVGDGRDDESTRIACGVVRRLHRRRSGAPPMPALSDWFRALAPAADRHGGPLAVAAQAARTLFASEQEPVPLHGDLHHGNILSFGTEWLAIDPQGVRGERTFDYVNLLRNPDGAAALVPGRLARQAGLICAAAGLERDRLLRWLIAFSGLSAAWLLADGDDAELDFAMIRIAEELLGG